MFYTSGIRYILNLWGHKIKVVKIIVGCGGSTPGLLSRRAGFTCEIYAHRTIITPITTVSTTHLLHYSFSRAADCLSLQCCDAVDWATERASGCVVSFGACR